MVYNWEFSCIFAFEIKIDKLGYVILNGKKTNVFVKPNEQSQVYLSYAMARKGRIYSKDFWNAKIYAPKQPLRLKIRNIWGSIKNTPDV